MDNGALAQFRESRPQRPSLARAEARRAGVAAFEHGLVREQVAEALDARDELADELAGAVGDRGLEANELGLGDELGDELTDFIELAAIALAQGAELAEGADAELGGGSGGGGAPRGELGGAALDAGGVEV